MTVNECTIGDLFYVARGGSPRPIHKFLTDDPDGINWIMIGDAAEGSKYIFSTKKKILRDGIEKSRMVYPGDFLLTNSMSFGRPYITQTKGCIHDGWLVLSPKNPEGTDRDFFYHLLGSPEFKRIFDKQAAGAVVKNLNSSLVRSIPLRVPKDVKDQGRIAAILDKTNGIRRKREQALAMADQLLRSTFLEMFGDPVLNTKNLPTISLGELIKVSSGNGLTARNMSANGVHPVYGGNGINGYHSEYMFEEPQVVIGRVGVYCGAVHLTRPKSWVTDNALYVREYRRPVNRVFLQWALRFANLNQFANRAAQPLISGSRIYPIKIVLPDKNRQSDFSCFVHRQNNLVAGLTKILDQTRELFSALSQRAFRGEL